MKTLNEWLVAWNLLGRSTELPRDMFLTIPEEVFDLAQEDLQALEEDPEVQWFPPPFSHGGVSVGPSVVPAGSELAKSKTFAVSFGRSPMHQELFTTLKEAREFLAEVFGEGEGAVVTEDRFMEAAALSAWDECEAFWWWEAGVREFNRALDLAEKKAGL